MEANEKIVFKVDVPPGFEIDKKLSNFATGEFVYKPSIIDWWEEALKMWVERNNKNYIETVEQLSRIPWYIAGSFRMLIWRSCFRYHPNIDRTNLTNGKYSITIYGEIKETDEYKRGELTFNSYEEAKFVNEMMKKYCKECYDCTTI